MGKRNLQYFTLSDIEPRIWFMLTGCDFHCRGCFRPARDGGGTLLSPEETLKRAEQACLKHYGTLPTKAMITGGEPTLDKEFLLTLVKGLEEKGFKEIILMSNGYEIGREGNDNYAAELKDAGLTEAHIDIKAFSDEIHIWYTGKSNKPVLNAVRMLNDTGMELLIQTVYMPGIVDVEEIEQIAIFLSDVNSNIKFRINPFAPSFAFERVTERPTIEDMERAYKIAAEYLPNAIISRSCYREYPTPPPQETWITVYPDLSFKRRTIKDQEEDRIAWLSLSKSKTREEILREVERDDLEYRQELEEAIRKFSPLNPKHR
uniref:Coenzyme PQQ synthesis protein n=2 Tax=unclassified Candidatus Methanophaga TaxID=3386245 RepID=Q64AN9_UNCAG|nr:coenzyme PQQ synthesis protein [uncultured archaeon GZfos30H9]QNO56255.1 GTP 3',8-cyclase [Methanosarcinales archaeon ANME-1 ERB7]